MRNLQLFLLDRNFHNKNTFNCKRIMLFKELKQNYPVYILDKQNVSFTQGKVISVSLPRMSVGSPMMPSSSPASMLVDVTIEADGRTATYSIPENLAVTYANNTVLSTDREGISREVEAMRATAEQVLNSVDRQKEILEKSKTLLAELNPAYKEKKETDERFNRIEGDVSEMKGMMKDLLDKLK